MSFNDDNGSLESETDQMISTLYANVILFCALLFCFEICRHMKSIYLNRYKKRFKKSGRVPNPPSVFPFGWIVSSVMVSDERLLGMVGLDGYMLMRYISICCRLGFFFSFWGVIVLVPIYHSASGHLKGWDAFTLANVQDDPSANELWAPAIFCYLFSAFYCQLMYQEYKNFISKRVQYLERGDQDTPAQTYYTVMLEKVPSDIKSSPMLVEFFEKLFPGDIYSVEVALDLHELEELTTKRRDVRNSLEKAIAVSKGTGRRTFMWVSKDFYSRAHEKLMTDKDNDICDDFEDVARTQLVEPIPVSENWMAGMCGFHVVDSIDHYTFTLEVMNDTIERLQKVYFDQRQKLDKIGEYRVLEMHNTAKTVLQQLVTSTIPFSSSNESGGTGEDIQKKTSTVTATIDSDFCIGNGQDVELAIVQDGTTKNTKNTKVFNLGAKMMGSSVGGLAKEGIKTAELATKGALRGVLEATRTLELLTFGAYYKTSTTAFVTFNSRVSVCSSHQMLLSHEHCTMDVKPAPNPKDIIWENVSIPQRQINIRKSIADSTLIVGALFWSIVVTFITAVSNLESIAEEFPQIQAYSDTVVYKFLNNYLAIGVLLILLAILPAIFDFISRHYEGMKLESEIQNSIMTRYFYYQLANVFVSVGLGSIATSLHEILNTPSSILSILGQSLPSFSIYFANLMIVKTFTALPIELLRLFPLIDILSVKLCIDKKKCTRRELRTGAFADPPVLYGWIYPNLLMVLMIMVTYSCISPFLMPFCTLYFSLAYVMYKYQLLYVYINDYQSGGFMWYAVFNRSTVALICGVCTLLCYLAIRKTFVSGPFYLLFPLPFILGFFWYDCERRFRTPALNLSLEGAISIDKSVRNRKEHGKFVPQQTFHPSLFRQPSLAEGRLKPSSYRKYCYSAAAAAAVLGSDIVKNGDLKKSTVAAMTTSDDGDCSQHLLQNTDKMERNRPRHREGTSFYDNNARGEGDDDDDSADEVDGEVEMLLHSTTLNSKALVDNGQKVIIGSSSQSTENDYFLNKASNLNTNKYGAVVCDV